MKKLFPFILLLLLVFDLHATWADETEPAPSEEALTVRSELSKAFMTIGDRVRFTVTVTHPQNYKILQIDLSETLRDFEIKEEKELEPQTENDLVKGGRTAVLTSFQLGEYVLMPAVITLRDEKGAEKQISSNKLFVTVESVDKSGQASGDIKGVKSVVKLALKNPYLFAFLLLLLGAGGGWLAWKRFPKARGLKEKGGLSLSPFEEASRDFIELIDSDWIKKQLFKRYFSKMSEIFRRYLERRLHLLALESTTEELALRLREKGELELSFHDRIRTLLEFFDLVKFAKFVPNSQDIFRINREAKILLESMEESLRANEMATLLPEKQGDGNEPREKQAG